MKPLGFALGTRTRSLGQSVAALGYLWGALWQHLGFVMATWCEFDSIWVPFGRILRHLVRPLGGLFLPLATFLVHRLLGLLSA